MKVLKPILALLTLVALLLFIMSGYTGMGLARLLDAVDPTPPAGAVTAKPRALPIAPGKAADTAISSTLATPSTQQPDPAITAALAVPSAVPVARSAIDRQEIRAQLLPRSFTTIAAEIGAKVNRLPVAEGGTFRAGQPLVAFDCSIQHAQLAKAKAEMDGAESTLKSNTRLAELNSVGLLDLDLSRAALARARAEVNANQAVLGKCVIPAPFTGRIAEQKIREQQYVQPGQALLEILDDSVLELEFLVPSRWLAGLKVGSPFQVEIDETRKTYPARFIRIGARVDPVSQSVKVAAAIDGKFPELIAGMSGRVQVAGMDGSNSKPQEQVSK